MFQTGKNYKHLFSYINGEQIVKNCIQLLILNNSTLLTDEFTIVLSKNI